ncbi:hypothetical protein [Microvirga zambiensis]|uniref:hypothetical protein n=1 Tax=Microvirga zambiensis TaxID=1402137 RepID=UPI00191DD86C|nr:hypothetical protein [Microvirga zambiensis]
MNLVRFPGVLMLVFIPSIAWAQVFDTRLGAEGIYDIISPYVFMLASAAVVGILTWLTNIVKQWTGIQIEAKHREALHSAMMTGVAAALAKGRLKASEVSIDAKSVIIKEAVEWAQRSVPDALNALGASPSALAELAASKITLLAEAPAGNAAGSPEKPAGV